MALKNRRTQKNKTNRRKQQSKRGGKRIGKNTKKNLRNKRQSRRRGGTGLWGTDRGTDGYRKPNFYKTAYSDKPPVNDSFTCQLCKDNPPCKAASGFDDEAWRCTVCGEGCGTAG